MFTTKARRARRKDNSPRSHALRGNAVSARCAASHDQHLAYTGRSAWERGVKLFIRTKTRSLFLRVLRVFVVNIIFLARFIWIYLIINEKTLDG